MKLSEFKNEFRLINTDTWANALDAWFECAGHMYNRGLIIPLEWEYSSGYCATEIDSYYHELFFNASDDELIIIGNFLFRYCEYLRFKGVNY